MNVRGAFKEHGPIRSVGSRTFSTSPILFQFKTDSAVSLIPMRGIVKIQKLRNKYY